MRERGKAETERDTGRESESFATCYINVDWKCSVSND